jgi:hypothetical protein
MSEAQAARAFDVSLTSVERYVDEARLFSEAGR